MKDISGRDKRKLKSLAHHLNPVVMVGQKGITETLIGAVDKALLDHELIKVKFVDLKDEKTELAERIASGTGSYLVMIIGNIAVFYRENPERPDGERIKL